MLPRRQYRRSAHPDCLAGLFYTFNATKRPIPPVTIYAPLLAELSGFDNSSASKAFVLILRRNHNVFTGHHAPITNLSFYLSTYPQKMQKPATTLVKFESGDPKLARLKTFHVRTATRRNGIFSTDAVRYNPLFRRRPHTRDHRQNGPIPTSQPASVSNRASMDAPMTPSSIWTPESTPNFSSHRREHRQKSKNDGPNLKLWNPYTKKHHTGRFQKQSA